MRVMSWNVKVLGDEEKNITIFIFQTNDAFLFDEIFFNPQVPM